ncbi:MAG: filamentous hemagglutinin N-terminal domain-containing protein [Cyanobacteria bacterium P01_H01_bin.21]
MNKKYFYLLSMTGLLVGVFVPSEITCQFASSAHAQVISDDTLSTTVTSPDNQNFVIEAGDRTGNNLFHSFDTFSIPTNGSAVFNTPAGIENIFSRVTGASISNIDGLLQTIGMTNLFLLNPNGVIFGPNAQLDVAGSFIASTADSLTFANGTEFSATVAEPALLSINVPLGLQLNTTQLQGDVESRGQLKTGQDLTLLGQNLYLEGTITAGHDLILQAQDTVTIRDTLARAGNDLAVQGGQSIDISALNRGQVPFVSDGNLTLMSDGDISADAHFKSGGNLQFLTLAGTPGTVVSLHDPIIVADGNVVLGDYTGVALKVEAAGSIEAGDIVITGPDTTLTADGSGSDEDLLASSRALILRSGIEPTVGPGSIIVSSINTSDITGGDGGPIILDAEGDITITGSFESPTEKPITVGSFSLSDSGDSGNGGAVLIFSQSGNIEIMGNLSSASFSLSDSSSSKASGDSGNGGVVTLLAPGNVVVMGRLRSLSQSFSVSRLSSSSGSSGNGAAVTIATIDGDITVTDSIDSSSASFAFSNLGASSSGRSGNGGDVTISSVSGDVAIANSLFTLSISNALSQTLSSSSERSGNGGAVTISSVSGDVTIGQLLRSSSESLSISPFSASSSNSGDGGNVIISSVLGDIVTGGNLLTSASTSFSNSDAPVSSISGSSGNGGSIILSSGSGDVLIDTDFNSFSFSSSNVAGQGGNISLIADGGAVIGDDVNLFAFSAANANQSTGKGGSVNLVANSAISGFDVFTLASNGLSGDIYLQGTGSDLTINDVRLTTTTQLEIPSFFGQFEPLEFNFNDFSQSGEVLIEGAGNIVLNNVDIQANANGSQPAGDVTVISPRQLTLVQSQINSNSSGTGKAGNIELTAERLVLRDASRLNATTLSSDGGNITLTLGDLLLLRQGSTISTTAGTARAGGNGGNITITLANGAIAAVPTENSDITANAFEGDGGRIQIAATGIVGLQFRPELTPLSDITASSQLGVDGVVQIDTPDLDLDQGTVELPSNLSDPSDQVSTGCLVAADNSLTVSGRSGLPDSPDIPNSSAVWEDWRPLETENELKAASIASQTPLREATEMMVDANGQVMFLASTDTRSESNIGLHQASCNSQTNMRGGERD